MTKCLKFFKDKRKKQKASSSDIFFQGYREKKMKAFRDILHSSLKFQQFPKDSRVEMCSLKF